MKKIIFWVMILMTYGVVSNACQTIQYSLFRLLNKTETTTDIKVITSFFCPSFPAPPLVGYIMETKADTLYFKVLYKGYIGAGSGYTQSRNDTFTNITLPGSINYLNISSNVIRVDGQGQTTDTAWNVKDSTFVLRPVGINDLYKNVPHIAVYPNPANKTLFFEKGLEYTQVQAYNSIGQLVATYPYNDTKSIDIGNLAKGLYFLKLTDDNEILGWARFVKTAY